MNNKGIALSFATAAVLTATAATAATTTNSGTGGFELPSQTCLIPAATPVVGTQLQVGACSSASATQFALAPSDNGSMTPTAQGPIVANSLCLDAASGTPEFNNCNLNPSQEWTWLPATSLLKSVSTGKCVNATGFTAGSTVSLASCEAGLDFQSYTPINFNMMFVSGIVSSSTEFGPHAAYLPPELPPSAVADSTVALSVAQTVEGAAKAAAGGGTLSFSGNVDDIQCLDILLDLETLANDQVDDFQCNATNAQWLHFTTGLQLESESGTCLTATGGSVGAAVNIEGCNGSAGQQWLYAGGHLASALDTGEFEATYCLDVQGGSGTPLTPVILNNCGYEDWPLGQYWWGNLIWPGNGKLTFTAQSGVIYASNPVAAQGAMTVTIDNSGNITLTGYAQDTGAFDYNYIDTVILMGTVDPSGNHPSLSASGTVNGSLDIFRSSATSTFTVTANDPAIAQNWYATTHGAVTFNEYFSTSALSITENLLEIIPDIPIDILTAGGATSAAEASCTQAGGGVAVGDGYECNTSAGPE